ncbi:MAG: DUF5131 family protein [Limnochordia bacterium]|nr:DUF5131 family protein [Limnochordia bacterium]
MALSKSGIEYLTHVWNFYPGCNHWKTGVCPVGGRCWAKGMAQRFRGGNFEPHLIPEKLLDPLKGRQGGRRIGVCFTGDLFGEWVDPEQEIGKQVEAWKLIEHQGWIAKPDNPLKRIVFEVIKLCPHDTFIFLTKNPARLANWSPFPDNCWVGATVCNPQMSSDAYIGLGRIKAKVKLISYEPVMESCYMEPQFLQDAGINWIVIGGWDRGKTQPQISWIKEIVEAADRTGIPVFLKDNLKPLVFQDKLWTEGLLNWAGELRQEYQTKQRIARSGGRFPILIRHE